MLDWGYLRLGAKLATTNLDFRFQIFAVRICFRDLCRSLASIYEFSTSLFLGSLFFRPFPSESLSLFPPGSFSLILILCIFLLFMLDPCPEIYDFINVLQTSSFPRSLFSVFYLYIFCVLILSILSSRFLCAGSLKLGSPHPFSLNPSILIVRILCHWSSATFILSLFQLFIAFYIYI